MQRLELVGYKEPDKVDRALTKRLSFKAKQDDTGKANFDSIHNNRLANVHGRSATFVIKFVVMKPGSTVDCRSIFQFTININDI